MALKVNNIFVNLPVKDLEKSVAFFSQIGFEFDPKYTNESATCMIIGDHIFAMLLVESSFQGFITKEIADTSRTAEVILALSADSREQVDEIVNRALAAGGKPSNDPIDHGFMYGWSFQDIDGHLWEVFYMNQDETV
ncbi:VOC family protein [Cohnella mopanensis]|uniref:VOC family protein n=1 Tax=Cohnella mopanensis TaxID=2911966 RepID=UPI001EF7D374|nr:VOC family protein [Cohnella mopanensis]